MWTLLPRSRGQAAPSLAPPMPRPAVTPVFVVVIEVVKSNRKLWWATSPVWRLPTRISTALSSTLKVLVVSPYWARLKKNNNYILAYPLTLVKLLACAIRQEIKLARLRIKMQRK